MVSRSVREREVSEWATEVTKLQQWWGMQQEWRESNNNTSVLKSFTKFFV